MGDDGVSGRNFIKRTLEVIKAYKNGFGNIWIIPSIKVFKNYFKILLTFYWKLKYINF